jgi:predicted  nucleic acid-binding Zn-ribbon protein
VSDADDLRSVMEADRWIERVSAQRTHLPEIAELSSIEIELRQLLHDLHEAQLALAPVKMTMDVATQESARLRKRAQDLDSTLSTSTANVRELTAIASELTHVRGLLAESEDRELELLVELEQREADVAVIKERAQPGVTRRSELSRRIEELQASLEDELVALRTDREQLVSALEPSLRSRYERSLVRSGTSGASQLVQGRCDGCRLALAPLDLDRLKALGPETFMDCPECGRILLT